MAEPGYYPKENIIVGSKQEMPAMTWLVKWMKSRENMPQVQKSLHFDGYRNNLTNVELDHMAIAGVKPFKNISEPWANAYAYIDDDINKRYTAYKSNSSLPTRIHERTHIMSANGPQLEYIQKLKDNFDYLDRDIISWIKDKTTSTKHHKSFQDYLDEPTEIYSRLMQLRYDNNINPKKIWTLDDIKKLRKNVKDYRIFSRYSDEFILKLFNEVAQNNQNSSEQPLYAKSGTKLNPIELFRKGRKVKTRAGEQTEGNFVRLNKENFWRRVNSDGTLTRVEDGQNGTYDYRNKSVPKKVKENTSWRIALANSVNPTQGYPSGVRKGYSIYRRVKNKQDSKDITTPDYKTLPALGDSVSNAAWRKYLGLNYDPKFLPTGVPDDRTDYGTNTVRLPKQLEKEIPTDTTFIKNRIAENEAYLNNGLPKPDDNIKVARQAIAHDTDVLNALRYTYKTGEPVGIYEGTYNSRKLINDGTVNWNGIKHTPLNVLQNYNIRYDKDTNRMYYSDEYGFDNSNPWPINWMGGYDEFLEGQPFRFRGYIDLNNK